MSLLFLYNNLTLKIKLQNVTDLTMLKKTLENSYKCDEIVYFYIEDSIVGTVKLETYDDIKQYTSDGQHIIHFETKKSLLGKNNNDKKIFNKLVEEEYKKYFAVWYKLMFMNEKMSKDEIKKALDKIERKLDTFSLKKSVKYNIQFKVGHNFRHLDCGNEDESDPIVDEIELNMLDLSDNDT